MKSLSKRGLALVLSIVIFVISAFILLATLTGGFKVKVRTTNFQTSEGVNLSGTLFVPSSATVETPAAGIVVCPGGNTPHVFYSSYCIELARRGYVVFAYDYYGTVGSEMSTEGNSGALAAMKYLSELSFVDSSRLGSTGHSNGGAQANAAIMSEYAQGAANRSVVFIGCGVPAKEPTDLDGTNVMAIWGKLDECGQGTFWDTYHKGAYNFGAFATLVGVDSQEVQVGNYYGDASNNSLRVIYTPNTFHCLSNLAPSSIQEIVEYFDATLGGNTSTLSSTSFIYIWEEIAVLLMALSLCVMIFPIGSMLLDLDFFKSIHRELPEAKTTISPKYWIFLLLPAIISALIVKTTVMQGQTILGKLPHIFNVQSTNGFIWWFFLSSLIGIVFYIIKINIDKSSDRKLEKARIQTSCADLAKAVLLSLITVGVPYLFTLFGERLTGWYGRIFQTYFASIAPARVGQYVVYYILFFIMFSVFAFIQCDGFRIKGASEKTNYIMAFIANALPAILFLGYLYGKLIITHVTPINGREMSRAQGAMMGMLLLYFVIAKVVTMFYKKTANIYVVAAMNAAFVTWLSVNTPQLMI